MEGRKVEKMLCVMNVAVLSRHTLMRYETDGGPELVEPRSPPPAPAPLLSSIHGNLGTAAARCRLPHVREQEKHLDIFLVSKYLCSSCHLLMAWQVAKILSLKLNSAKGMK